MENKPEELNVSEPKQVSGSKSFEGWWAYFDTIRTVPKEDRQQLLNAALQEISDDPALSNFDKLNLARMIDTMW